jgi:hypothetical protein
MKMTELKVGNKLGALSIKFSLKDLKQLSNIEKDISTIFDLGTKNREKAAGVKNKIKLSFRNTCKLAQSGYKYQNLFLEGRNYLI